jgi:hypothetical protein
MTTTTLTAAGKSLPKTRRRTVWISWALFLLAFGILEGVNHGLGAWLALGFGLIAPDFSFFFGGRSEGEQLQHGQLPRRTVPFYNAVHRTWIPFAAVVAYSVGPVQIPALFTFLIAWMLHIAVDRVAGYNLRTKDGFIRG